ncbi:MAG: hypothetical protein PHY92_07865 [Alphaproteobacteria bacterium]|nr:hypothetical protein [Alphaproteobacteria bacterium]
MRLLKLFAIAAVLAALAAGPVVAQDAVEPATDNTMAPADTGMTAPAAEAAKPAMTKAKKHAKKRAARKHRMKMKKMKKKAMENGAADGVSVGK